MKFLNQFYRCFIPLLFCLLWSPVEVLAESASSAGGDTSWLAGNWGVRFVIPGYGLEGPAWSESDSIVSELTKLETVSWVMLNLTHPSFGGIFTSSEGAIVDGISGQEGDRLGVLVRALKLHGKRVILYVAAQGSDLDFLGEIRQRGLQESNPKLWDAVSAAREVWRSRSVELGTSEKALFVKSIENFSEAYGELVDGWWFDHGHLVPDESSRLIAAARKGNADALVAWNEGHRRGVAVSSSKVDRDVRPWLLTETTDKADFTDGHVTPMRFADPWWAGNKQILSQLDTWYEDGFRAVPHVFLPAQSDWRAGREFFPVAEAVVWTQDAIQACGGITWALQLKAPEFSSNQLAQQSIEFARAINEAVKKIERPSGKCLR